MARIAFLIAFALFSHLPGTEAQRDQPDYPQFENQSRVYLSSDRGYRDVLISIGEYVAEDPKLIEGIKKVFTDLSSFLHAATNEYGLGVHLEEVRILIPDTWRDDPSYETRTWESFGASDIQVDHPPENSLLNENQPSTSKPTHCGAPGMYMHLTPDYITDDSAAALYGNRNKTLTHEWAHYRWGVFDEYPTHGYPHFYPGANGEYEPTTCVAGIRGKARKLNGEPCSYDDLNAPDNDCRFFDEREQTGTYEGSLMYKQYLPKMRTFCDSHKHTSKAALIHNAMAPNEQNDLCSSRSIWEVLREHSDFQNVTSSGQKTNLVPTFRLIKRKESRSPVMIILDVSGSMDDHQRLHVLRQASYNLITRVLNNGQVFGAVQFESDAQTVITTQVIGSNREQLTALLPKDADGGTSIGAGIRQGIAALQGYGEDYTGTEMVVLTDGDENAEPYIAELTDSELSGITVHTIAIGPGADPSLEELAVRTGGKTFEHSDQSAALFNIFTELAVQDGIGTLIILSESFNLTGAVRRFSVDSFSEGNITVLVGFPENSLSQYSVKVVKPNGGVIDGTAVAPDRYRLVPEFDLVQIDTNSMAGDWAIYVNTTTDVGNPTTTGTMHVETKRRVEFSSSGVPIRPATPIVADVQWALSSMEPSQIQTVAVTVHQGYTPITGATVNIMVMVNMNRAISLSAYDDGLGADVRANDGVYSAFFTQFSGMGRYSLQVTVIGSDGITKLMKGSRVGQGLAAYDPNLLPEFQPKEVDTGSFERRIEGNSFVCIGDLCQGDEDVYSPFRIRDLRAVRGDNLTAVLTFTATGDDLDYGTADHYEIHISTDHRQMVERFHETEKLEFVPGDKKNNGTFPPYVISGNLSSPKASRTPEVFHVALPDKGGFSYIFSVVAVDDEGRRSQPSTLASVTARPAIMDGSGKINDQQVVQEPSSNLLVIIGVLLALFTLVSLAAFTLLFVKRRQSDNNVHVEKVGSTAAREHAPGDGSSFGHGSLESDRMTNHYQFTDASSHNAEGVRGANKIYTNNVGRVGNRAVLQDHRNGPDSQRFGNSASVPRGQYGNGGSTPRQALQPPRATETTEDLIYDDTAEDLIYDDTANDLTCDGSTDDLIYDDTATDLIYDDTAYDQPPQGNNVEAGVKDESVYPFVSVGSAIADDTHSAYQFTRVAETTYEVHHAGKIYDPVARAATNQVNDNGSDDEDDYEDVPDPHKAGIHNVPQIPRKLGRY